MRFGTQLTSVTALACLAVHFAPAVAGYARDNHYQSHFLFLWVFVAIAWWRGGGPGFPERLGGLGRARDAAGWTALALAVLLDYCGLLTGSSTIQRLALVATVTGIAVLGCARWSTRRCLAWSAFLVLCFGVPYSAYFQVTNVFRSGYLWLLGVPSRLGLLDYEVDGASLLFPHYRLDIVEDCSGFTQLITFVGLATAGALVGAPRTGRIVLLFAAAAGGAVLANGFRLLVFVLLVAAGHTEAIDEPWLHETLGFATYLPFVLGMVWLILHTHRRCPPREPLPRSGRSLPTWCAALPLLAVWLAVPGEPPPDLGPPAFLAGVDAPPGYRLELVAPNEVAERDGYGTPWLVNRRFVATSGPERSLEVFAYLTRSRAHLNVHQISNCLEVPGEDFRYGPAIEVGGRTFWTFEIQGGSEAWHGYYAFHVDGQDCDDKIGTKWDVFLRRLRGHAREVGLTRFLMPGPLRVPIPPDDQAVLAWRAKQLRDLNHP